MKTNIATIYDAIKSNPFTEESLDLYKIITKSKSTNREELRQLLGKELLTFINTSITIPKKKLQDFNKKDQEKIKYSFLFYLYINYTEKLNDLIIQQNHLEEPVSASFYKEFSNELISFGIDEDKTSHYFSMFYQLRRAYYFIDQFLKGSSSSISNLRADIWNCIFTSDLKMYDTILWNKMDDFSILLTAPTGTGKSLIAKIIAYSSYIPFNPETSTFIHSFKDLFKSVNLTEFSETLIEAELFGHEKGAFTDAHETRSGIFSNTSTSHTIFLDEIGETPTQLQIKLLRVLQDRTFYPVGSHESQHFFGRIIGATNKTLVELRDPNQFRSDFFYRLSSNIIQVPTLLQQLKQEPEDITLFVEHITNNILQDHSADYIKPMLEYIKKNLSKYKWPGNVRELEQCIRRLIMSKTYTPPQSITSIETKEMTAQQYLQDYTIQLFDKYKSYSKVSQILQLDRRTVKKYIIESED